MGQFKSWFKQIPCKTKSQNLKHDLYVLNPPNPTKPKIWFEVSPKSSQKSSPTKSKIYLIRYLDPQLSPAKKCFVPNVDVLDFVGDFFWGMIIIIKGGIRIIFHLMKGGMRFTLYNLMKGGLPPYIRYYI